MVAEPVFSPHLQARSDLLVGDAVGLISPLVDVGQSGRRPDTAFEEITPALSPSVELCESALWENACLATLSAVSCLRRQKEP
jgi:hypothetical protein